MMKIHTQHLSAQTILALNQPTKFNQFKPNGLATIFSKTSAFPGMLGDIFHFSKFWQNTL